MASSKPFAVSNCSFSTFSPLGAHIEKVVACRSGQSHHGKDCQIYFFHCIIFYVDVRELECQAKREIDTTAVGVRSATLILG